MHTIRRLNLGEAALYRSLRLEALRDAPYAFLSSYESALQRDDSSWRAQSDAAAHGSERAIFLAFDDRPIGLAALYRDPNDNSVGELLQMWIAPTHRGGSAAADLLAYLIQWAAKDAFTSIRAEVTPGNRRALRFYEKRGFQQCSTENGSTVLVREVEPINQNGS